MNIFGCALQYCYIKVMLKVTKARETIKNYNKKYITCTAFLASVYILVVQACHLWPHSTCPLLDTPLVFHNHNLHLAPRSCCHSTNHCYELVIRYSCLWNFNFHYEHIRNQLYALRKWKNEAVKNLWGKRYWKFLSLFLPRFNFSRSFSDSE